jgi:hypothetical protein
MSLKPLLAHFCDNESDMTEQELSVLRDANLISLSMYGYVLTTAGSLLLEHTPGAPDAPDMVEHPPHYTAGGIECIDAIKAALTPEEFRGYCKGNAMKYTWRERMKGGDEDLRKAAWYLARAIK